MPRKIKVVWILCCICIFLGFGFLSAKNQARDNQQRKQEAVEKNKQRTEEKKRRQEMETQVVELMGRVQELNVLGKYDEAAEMASKAAKMDPKNAKTVVAVNANSASMPSSLANLMVRSSRSG